MMQSQFQFLQSRHSVQENAVKGNGFPCHWLMVEQSINFKAKVQDQLTKEKFQTCFNTLFVTQMTTNMKVLSWDYFILHYLGQQHWGTIMELDLQYISKEVSTKKTDFEILVKWYALTKTTYP